MSIMVEDIEDGVDVSPPPPPRTTSGHVITAPLFIASLRLEMRALRSYFDAAVDRLIIRLRDLENSRSRGKEKTRRFGCGLFVVLTMILLFMMGFFLHLNYTSQERFCKKK